MTTRAPETLVWLADQFENLPEYPSAVFAGIVPDAAHLDNGGYHCSIEDLIRFGNGGDYSNIRQLDKSPPVTRPTGIEQAAALDVSLSKPDMVRLYGRVKKVFDDTTDPRRKWINAWNVWDGIAVHRPTRFNFQSNTVGTTDKSHEWHTHVDWPRAYVDLNLSSDNAWTAAEAALSIIKGETKEQWEDGMAFTEEDAKLNAKVLLQTNLGSSGPTVGVALQATYNNVRDLQTKMAKALQDLTQILEILETGAPVPGEVTVSAASRDDIATESAKATADLFSNRLTA